MTTVQDASDQRVLLPAHKNTVGGVITPGDTEAATHFRRRGARGGRSAPEVTAGIKGEVGSAVTS